MIFSSFNYLLQNTELISQHLQKGSIRFCGGGIILKSWNLNKVDRFKSTEIFVSTEGHIVPFLTSGSLFILTPESF